jgi:hypothetical protein
MGRREVVIRCHHIDLRRHLVERHVTDGEGISEYTMYSAQQQGDEFRTSSSPCPTSIIDSFPSSTSFCLCIPLSSREQPRSDSQLSTPSEDRYGGPHNTTMAHRQVPPHLNFEDFETAAARAEELLRRHPNMSPQAAGPLRASIFAATYTRRMYVRMYLYYVFIFALQLWSFKHRDEILYNISSTIIHRTLSNWLSPSGTCTRQLALDLNGLMHPSAYEAGIVAQQGVWVVLGVIEDFSAWYFVCLVFYQLWSWRVAAGF